ncbi:MAG: hypothetical protein OWT28_06465 [Firmicutes bacterium]|nr:hypothetical protein [Bacillota bacterium]
MNTIKTRAKRLSISFFITDYEREFIEKHEDINYSETLRGLFDSWIKEFDEEKYLEAKKMLYKK